MLLGPSVGYAIGELISRVINRKRGPELAVIAGADVVISYLGSVADHRGFPLIPLNLLSLLFDLLALALGVVVAVTRLG